MIPNFDERFLENFIKLCASCEEDNDFSVQVVENDEDDDILYFKPLNANVEAQEYSGMFFPERKDAVHINNLWNKMSDSSFNLYADPANGEFDSIMITIHEYGEGVAVNIGTTLELSEDDERRDKFIKRVLDYLGQKDISFSSINDETVTKLGLDENIEQLLLDSAVDFYHFFRENVGLPGANLVSPITGEQSDFLVMIPPRLDQSDFVVFCLFPSEESLSLFAQHAEDAANPAGKEFMDGEDLMFLDIRPKAGKLIFKDEVHGNLKNWSEDEKRKLIIRFLNVVKDVWDDLEE